MQTRSCSAVFTLTCLFSMATSLVAAEPVAPLPADTPSPVVIQAKNFQPISLSNELDTIKGLLKEIDQRIRRLELLTEYERAVEVRNAALAAWRNCREERGTLTKAEFEKKDIDRRSRYFEARADTDRILSKLGEFYK